MTELLVLLLTCEFVVVFIGSVVELVVLFVVVDWLVVGVVGVVVGDVVGFVGVVGVVGFVGVV